MSESQLASGFMVIHGNRPELLRQLLVHWYKSHPLLPLENEAILVQSNGIAQWLKLALAATESKGAEGGCGIAAAIDTLLPSRFIWQAYRAVLGPDSVPKVSPFDKPLLIWRLMRLLPGLSGQPGYEPLARFLMDDTDQRKRFQLAEKVADLFDQYQVYRADWLDAWSRGEDVLLDARGTARPLDPRQAWQARLWRALLDDVGDAAQHSRAAVHRRFLLAARELQARPAGLPRRITVFGLTALPRQSLEVLLGISRVAQVILCVNNPCEHYWADLLSAKDVVRRAAGRHRRKTGMPDSLTEEELHLHAHPLLAAWGKQGREYIALLDELDQPESYRAHFEAAGERIDVFASHGEGSLLNQLQDDIRALRPLHETRAQWPAVDPAKDRSVRFHVVHSAQREVEVLHDQLLAAFDADPSLRPRDVIVMVPDINAYAPHIQAVFGQIDRNDDRHLPFSIADQSQHSHIPLYAAVEFLLGAAESRLSVSNVLDLLDVPAVRKRFGIDDHALPTLRRWIEQTNIRWGLDGLHREQFVAQGFDQNSWQEGLRRMLLGYAVGEDPADREELCWRGIEPYGEVAGLEAALLGPLASLVKRLGLLIANFSEAAPPAIWGDRLQAMLSDFFDPEGTDDAFRLQRLRTALRLWIETCESARLDEPVSPAVVRDHWLAQLDQGGLSQRFMAGRVTFATLMPMRAIPFRKVCLLGMNDGDFPRIRPPVDFDLMAHDARPGDRSRRDDDRYLFLEALLSAREKLHISWVGRSIHDNTERPPSVLVSQLRDHLSAGWQHISGSGRLVDTLTVEHPLQPFSPEYFVAAAPDAARFTYAREWERCAAPSAASGDVALPTPAFDAPIPLDRLSSFLKDPVKAFFNDRLGVRYETQDVTSEDDEPFAIDSLEEWGLQNQLVQTRLDAMQRGESEAEAVDRLMARIHRRGELPVGPMGDLVEERLKAPLDEMFERYRAVAATWPERLDDTFVSYAHNGTGAAVVIHGRIDRHYRGTGGRCRIELNTSNLLENQPNGKGKYRRDKLLTAWVRHLADHLDGTPTTTFVVGKNGTVRIRPLEADRAKVLLATFVDAYLEGLCRPLPLAPKTGFAWLEKQGKPFAGPLSSCTHKAASEAQACYDGAYMRTGEVAENDYLQRVYPSFSRLWSNGEFTQLSDRLLAPLMEYVGESTAQD